MPGEEGVANLTRTRCISTDRSTGKITRASNFVGTLYLEVSPDPAVALDAREFTGNAVTFIKAGALTTGIRIAISVGRGLNRSGDES